MSNQSQVGTQLILLVAGAIILYYAVIRPARKGTKGDVPRRVKASLKKKSGGQAPKAQRKVVDPNSPEGWSARFQGYVEQHFASRMVGTHCELKRWPADELNYYPDLEVVCTLPNEVRRFALECKYRPSLQDGFVEFAYDEQLKRYKNFEDVMKLPLVIVLGVGGLPESPAEIFLIPLDGVYQPYLSEQQLKEFQIDFNEIVSYFFPKQKK
jgi:hypothetical protein